MLTWATGELGTRIEFTTTTASTFFLNDTATTEIYTLLSQLLHHAEAVLSES